MKKKLWACMAVVVLVATAIGGCSSPVPSETEQETQKDSLEVWTFYDCNVPGYYYMFAWDDLEKQYNCTLDVKNFSKAEMDTKLLTALATGELPDIFYLGDGEYVQEFIEAKVCLPVQSYISDLSYEDGYVTEYSNNVYVVPCTPKKYYVTYYNVSLLEEIGLSIPTSYEELQKMNRQIQRYNKLNDTDYVLFECGDKEGESFDRLLNEMVQYLDEDAWQQYMTDNAKDYSVLKEAATKLTELGEDGAFNKNVVQKGHAQAVTDFIGGEAVMMVDSSDIAYHLIQNMGEDGFEMVNFLDNDKLICETPDQTPGLCVNANSDNSGLAAQICAAYAKRMNELNVTQQGYLNMLTDDYEQTGTTPKQIDFLKQLVQDDTHVTGYSSIQIDKDNESLWKANNKKYLLGDITLKEYMKTAKDCINP
ncbi:MAG: ABC transporter substrate-binding protein [Eubacterium sp.]|nr:ABC transporter substrate-binding protein [Eubacterium sp.]